MSSLQCQLNELLKRRDVNCVESQEWTFGVDNTGTNFRWPSATYELKLSNGARLIWQQTTASNGGWTNQLEEWAQAVQQAADDAGYEWLVEPRFIWPDSNDLSGGGGLPGPPTSAISAALYAAGMRWRYLNIQICPGQPTPIGACLLSVEDSGGFNVSALPRNLTASDAVLGPIKKFWQCIQCYPGGGDIEWLKQDPENAARLIPAEAVEIPFCWEPCGTIALTDPPPSQECQTLIVDGCDNNNQTDPTQFIQSVQRHTTICGTDIVDISYYRPDSADPTAFNDYALTGQFVDCASGAVIDEEVPPPKDYILVGTLYKFIEQDQGVGVEYWQPAALGGSAAPHDDVTAIFGSELNAHPNAPDYVFTINSLNVATPTAAFLTAAGLASNADTNGTDQLRVTFFTCSRKSEQLVDSNGNTGERGAIVVNGELVAEDTTDSTAADRAALPPVDICAGVNKVVVATSDLSAWQGYQPAGSDDLFVYASQPQWEPVKVYKCADLSGGFVDCDGVDVEVGAKDFWDSPPLINC